MNDGGQQQDVYGWRRTKDVFCAKSAIQIMKELRKEINFQSLKEAFPEKSSRQIAQVLMIYRNKIL